MDDNNNIKLSRPVPPFLRYCSAIIPTAFDDSLSYYEALCALYKWLQTNVIDTINHNASVTNDFINKEKELEELFEQLKEYVDTYFENLDVQEEINNKLNAMVEDGTLQEIIGDYLNANAVWGFDNVADMKSSTNLIDGSYARTLGYYAKNDGGSAIYKIREITNDDVVDESTIIEIGDEPNELVAELIVEEPINVKTLGVYGDGTHDDYAKIQLGITKFPHHTLYFPTGTYLITRPIEIGTTNAEQVDLKLESDAVIKTDTTIDSLLEIGKYEGQWKRRQLGSIVTIDGGTFDATHTTQAIYVSSNRKLTNLFNLNVINTATYGIYVDRGANTSASADCNIENVNISGKGSYESTTGLYLKAYDNKITNSRIEGVKIAVEDNGGSFFSNVHVLMDSDRTLTTAEFQDTIAFLLSGTGAMSFNQCYADTFATAFKITTYNRTQIDNCMAYWYYSDANATTKFIHFSSNAGGKVSVNNTEYDVPSNGTAVGLDLTGVTGANVLYIGTSGIFEFNNIILQGAAGKLAKNDYILDRTFYNDKQIVLCKPWTKSMTQNAYYPIAYLKGGIYDLKIWMAQDQCIQASIKVDRNSSTITITNKYNGAHSGAYRLALCDGGNDTWGHYGAMLCVKSVDTTSSFNPAIVSGISEWNNALFSCYLYQGLKALTSPTVVVEERFNP